MKVKAKHANMFILLIFLTGCGKSDPFPSMKLPSYPNAINLHHKIDSPTKGAKAVVYNLSMDFPAEKLTDFYNREIQRLGFTPLPEEGIGTFKWESHNNSSGNWEETTEIPARYTATWVNKEKTQRIWLYIAFGPRRNITNWENTPFVSCNMAEYFDMDMVKEHYEVR